MVKSCFWARGWTLFLLTCASRGLDPRVTLNTAQAATDPRIKSGGGDCGWDSVLSKHPRVEPEGGMVGGRKQARQAGLRYW